MQLELTAIARKRCDTGSGIMIRLDTIGADAPTPGAKTSWPTEAGTLVIAKWTHGPLRSKGRLRRSIDATGQAPSERWTFVPDEMDTATFTRLAELMDHELAVTFEPAQKSLM